MGKPKWIQTLLPVFDEPILPGDFVRVKKLTMESDDQEEIGQAYLGCNGQVLELDHSEKDGQLFLLHFGDHAEFWFKKDELERLA